MKDKRILFQGDSITDGNRYKTEEDRWDGNHQIGHSYAFIVTGDMMANYPERHLRFYNRGVSGNTVVELDQRWEDASILMNPDVLSIHIGTNDVARCEKLEDRPSYYEKFDRLFRGILTQSRENNPDLQIILMEPFRLHVAKHETEEQRKDRFEILFHITEMEKKIAQDFDALYIPTQEMFAQACQKRDAVYWSWDGVHPTEAGHYLLAQQWMRYAKDIVLA